MDFKTMEFDDIVAYCKEHNELDWLESELDKKYVDKKTGEEREATYIEVKKAFVKKFMPEIAPKAKPKKPSMRDKLAAARNG